VDSPQNGEPSAVRRHPDRNEQGLSHRAHRNRLALAALLRRLSSKAAIRRLRLSRKIVSQ